MQGEVVSGLRRRQKKNTLVVKKRTLIYVIFQISIVSIILLLPMFSPSLLAHQHTLLALCTLFLFGGGVVYLAIRSLMMVSDWLGSGKHAIKPMATSCSKIEGQPLEKTIGKPSFWVCLKEVVTVLAWAFLLKLLQPFIAAVVWWQGYKLLEGKVFSLGEIDRMAIMIEYLVYFGIAICLLIIIEPYWHYVKGKGATEKIAVPNTEIVAKIPMPGVAVPYEPNIIPSRRNKAVAVREK